MRLSKYLVFAEVHNPENFPENPDKYQVIAHLGKLYSRFLGDSSPKAEDISNPIAEREKLVTTGVGYGIAFPHAKVKGLERIGIGIYRLPENFDWETMDRKPVEIAVSVIAPQNAIGAHLNTMARLSYILKNQKNRNSLLEALRGTSGQTDTKAIEAMLDSY